MREKAQVHYAEAIPLVEKLRNEGLSFAAIAARMNADGFESQTRKPWTPMTAKRVFEMKA